ncbi:MAG: hypothetical protein NZM00_14175 [Anaerolinea sp.]|nr:hypothetical protein [Anaerolinea sp.]
MAIEYAVDLGCEPKSVLGTAGILERLKERARANLIIQQFRAAGDQRPPSQMGFEFTRSSLDGDGETELLIVQDLLDRAAELDPLAVHCAGCPASLTGQSFGCIGQINYPISDRAEAWLLDQLPTIEQPLIWLLLREGSQKLGHDSALTRQLRASGQYFEERRLRGRDLTEFVFSADQVFEMLFLMGHIQPHEAGILLMFFNAIPRDAEADTLVAILKRTLPPQQIAAQFPFLLRPEPDDDRSIAEFKAFFRALHTAWILDRQVLLDV